MALDGTNDPVLACGVAFEALVDQVAEHTVPVDAEHQAGCEHCQAALQALSRAWGEVEFFARQPVRVPAGLTARIMTEIRALVARWGDAAVLIGARGETRISESVLAQVARRAALLVPGVALASALGAAVDPVDRSRVRFTLRLAIIFGPAVDTLADAVRAEISRHVSAHTGMRVSAIEIVVEDILADV